MSSLLKATAADATPHLDELYCSVCRTNMHTPQDMLWRGVVSRSSNREAGWRKAGKDGLSDMRPLAKPTFFLIYCDERT